MYTVVTEVILSLTLSCAASTYMDAAFVAPEKLKILIFHIF